jgi:hypothetical protein
LTLGQVGRILLVMNTRKLGAALIVVVGLVSGCREGEESHICAGWACDNRVTLTGSVEVSTQPTLVDVSYCSPDDCQSGIVDITRATVTTPACGQWNQSTVCLTATDAGLEVLASWGGGGENPPVAIAEYHLELVDHQTGEVLLNTTRHTSYEVKQVDDCHRCWHAEMSL